MLCLLRGGSYDGTHVWVKNPGRMLRMGEAGAIEYRRGSGDVWWHPTVPDPEPIEGGDQLALM